jgi:hypothetical protein
VSLSLFALRLTLPDNCFLALSDLTESPRRCLLPDDQPTTPQVQLQPRTRPVVASTMRRRASLLAASAARPPLPALHLPGRRREFLTPLLGQSSPWILCLPQARAFVSGPCSRSRTQQSCHAGPPPARSSVSVSLLRLCARGMFIPHSVFFSSSVGSFGNGKTFFLRQLMSIVLRNEGDSAHTKVSARDDLCFPL